MDYSRTRFEAIRIEGSTDKERLTTLMNRFAEKGYALMWKGESITDKSIDRIVKDRQTPAGLGDFASVKKREGSETDSVGSNVQNNTNLAIPNPLKFNEFVKLASTRTPGQTPPTPVVGLTSNFRVPGSVLSFAWKEIQIKKN